MHTVRLLSAYQVAPTLWSVTFALWTNSDRVSIHLGSVSTTPHEEFRLRGVNIVDTGHFAAELRPDPRLPAEVSAPIPVDLGPPLRNQNIPLGDALSVLLSVL